MALRDALVTANHLCPVLTNENDPTAVDTAARRVVEERMPEIIAIQAYQQRMTRTFLGSDRLSSRVATRLLPFLARPSLLRLLAGERLHGLQHGTVPVRLTA
jgi:2-polyprenyl-6-methoxyphenol hydroxylase-like FAD-dependent oxidoreductase